LHAFGTVSGVEWSSRWVYDGICGDGQASWLWATRERPPWLQVGAEVVVTCSGRRRFAGRLNEPEEMDGGWSCSAYGLSALGGDFESILDSDPGVDVAYLPTTSPDLGIDAAIGRGLPWVRLSDFGLDPVGTEDALTLNVRDVVTRAAKLAGKRAVVDQFGGLSLVSDPTSPVWLLGGVSNFLGSADDEFVTRMLGYYVSGVDGTTGEPSDWAMVIAQDSNAEDKFGAVVERTVDLTALGLLTEGEAQAHIAGRFALVGGRMGWTSGFAVTRSWLSRMNGAPGDPAAVRAGDMIRLAGVRDFRTTAANRAAADIVVGEAKYVADEDVCHVTPLGYVPRDFSSALAAAQKPPTEDVA
jgi:hypothetical protein